NPEELATARFSMSAAPMLLVVPARGGAGKERLEPAPAAGTGGLGTMVRTLSSTARESSREKRYPVLRLSFQFQVGGEKPSAWPRTYRCRLSRPCRFAAAGRTSRYWRWQGP